MKLGKRGKQNKIACRKLKSLFLAKGITFSEISESIENLTWMHRHKRRDYYSCPEMLYSFNQVMLVTMQEHMNLEYDRVRTEALFLVKRGPDLLLTNVTANIV